MNGVISMAEVDELARPGLEDIRKSFTADNVTDDVATKADRALKLLREGSRRGNREINVGLGWLKAGKAAGIPAAEQRPIWDHFCALGAQEKGASGDVKKNQPPNKSTR
jgi:hypothetical protein